MRIHFCAIVALLWLVTLAPAQTKLASTPPMGWNSWNWFFGKVTDQDIRQAADLMVSSDMRDAGSIYVNIDDTWEGKRDEKGPEAALKRQEVNRMHFGLTASDS